MKKICLSFPICNKEELYSLLNYITKLLSSSKYKELNDSNRIGHYQMEKRFKRAYKRLENLPEKITLSNGNLLPNDIKRDWIRFDNLFDGVITETVKRDYGALIKKTASFLKYIESLPANKIYQHPLFNARSIDLEEVKEKEKQLKKQYDKIKELLDNEKSTNGSDTQNFNVLLKKLNSVVQEMKEVRDKVESVDADRKAETNWADRIKQAFNDLSVYTQPIEKEKGKVTAEYWVLFTITWVLVFSFCLFYYLFIKGVQEYDIILCTWLDYLPYGMMLPLYGLLIWLCVYQKNRAHKISIELTTYLFNIQYLEGLLKLTNTLSATPNEAIIKIDHAVDSMLQSYLKQADYNQLSEVKLSQIETKELESSPYWKLLQEIKELIKTIK